METKHTPGPWNNVFTSDNSRGVRTNAGFICILPKPTHYVEQDERYERELDENKANAKLIAAAPELLDVLLKAHRYFEQELIYNEVRQDMERAIKKATE